MQQDLMNRGQNNNVLVKTIQMKRILVEFKKSREVTVVLVFQRHFHCHLLRL